LRAVLFDLDGTLLNSERSDILAMGRLFHDDLGLDMDEEEISKYVGISSRDVLEQLAPDRVEELLAVWLAYQEELLVDTHLFPGIPEILRSMSRSNLGLGVVTGQSKSELNVTRRHVGIDGLIDVWVSADDAAFAKPHPAPVRLALETLGCLPDQAVMIGDTRFDMEAGRKAGTLLGVALWGVKDVTPLLEYQPEFIFEDPKQIQELLLRERKKGGGNL
jgi:HAD superfamily hydrolase (TIGR01509 family)